MVNKKTFEIIDAAELKAVAEEILENFKNERIFLLNGDLGAGKTSLCKEMIFFLTGIDNATSPTFNIVNSYEEIDKPGLGNQVYHYDLYRLKNNEEILELGMDECLNKINLGNSYIFIEWPEKALKFLGRLNRVNIEIKLRQNYRSIEVTLVNYI